MDFNVTEQKIVNDIVSGPLWKKTLRKIQFVSFYFCIQDEHPQLSEKIIKKYYSHLCEGFFTFTVYHQNNRFSADANLKIQQSSSERDRKDTWKKCKKLYTSHYPVYFGKQSFILNAWVINIILNKLTKSVLFIVWKICIEVTT